MIVVTRGTTSLKSHMAVGDAQRILDMWLYEDLLQAEPDKLVPRRGVLEGEYFQPPFSGSGDDRASFFDADHRAKRLGDVVFVNGRLGLNRANHRVRAIVGNGSKRAVCHRPTDDAQPRGVAITAG